MVVFVPPLQGSARSVAGLASPRGATTTSGLVVSSASSPCPASPLPWMTRCSTTKVSCAPPTSLVSGLRQYQVGLSLKTTPHKFTTLPPRRSNIWYALLSTSYPRSTSGALLSSSLEGCGFVVLIWLRTQMSSRTRHQVSLAPCHASKGVMPFRLFVDVRFRMNTVVDTASLQNSVDVRFAFIMLHANADDGLIPLFHDLILLERVGCDEGLCITHRSVALFEKRMRDNFLQHSSKQENGAFMLGLWAMGCTTCRKVHNKGKRMPKWLVLVE